jgi:uncharacterized caspase-like protein
MLEYLSSVHGISARNVCHLTNSLATRQAILDAFFNHLLCNSSIMRGDAIIFYFAGHGGRQDVDGSWISEGNKVEVICPYDVQPEGGIPDFTIASLLRRLNYEKGDNVVSADAFRRG